MTAIAYANGLLVADSLIVEAGKVVCWLDKVKEIKAKDGSLYLLTGAGSCSDVDRFFDWAERMLAGQEVGDPPKIDEGVGIMVCPDGSYFQYSEGAVDGPWMHPNGWGYEHFITGALEVTGDPVAAVQAACARIVTCGGPIKVYRAGVGWIQTLEEPPKIVMTRGSYVDKAPAVGPNVNIGWVNHQPKE